MAGNQTFARARRPEHKVRRRAAILAAALDLATRDGVQGVTLGAVAAAVGLAKSNVLRYFGTREEIYLALAARQWQEWAADVAVRLAAAAGEPGTAGASPGGRNTAGPEAGEPEGRSPRPGATELAEALTASLTERPEFCDLQSVLATTLERHAGLEAAREYKRAAVGALTETGARIAASWPYTAREGFELAGAATTFAGMLWPMARPPDVLRTLYQQEPSLAIACPPFAPTLERLIRALAEGLPVLRTP